MCVLIILAFCIIWTLKLLAAYHVFTIGMLWYTTGVMPSGWQLVWCFALLVFLFAKVSVKVD